MKATVTYRTGSEPVGRDTGNDAFHDPVVIGIGVTVVIVTLVIRGDGRVVLLGSALWHAVME